jgi:hypothetical protein
VVLTSFMRRHGRADPAHFPPLERVELEALACCEPAGIGLEITHWSTRSLARVAVERGIVPRIAHSTISLLLRDADLQPHRWRYWKTPTLNEEFRLRAASVLWCYEQAAALAGREEVVVCLDEKPNLQVLERRCPKTALSADQIERQEFEYRRHGTVNVLVRLEVHSGRMRAWCLERNDGACLRAVLPEVLAPYRKLRRVHLIWDGGPSHVAADTQQFLHNEFPRVRPLLTPAHASWLDQAELLLRAFAERYLKRGSWASRQAMVNHIAASWPEYNRWFAHPFDWSWTRYKMHTWMDRHADPGLC